MSTALNHKKQDSKQNLFKAMSVRYELTESWAHDYTVSKHALNGFFEGFFS